MMKFLLYLHVHLLVQKVDLNHQRVFLNIFRFVEVHHIQLVIAKIN